MRAGSRSWRWCGDTFRTRQSICFVYPCTRYLHACSSRTHALLHVFLPGLLKLACVGHLCSCLIGKSNSIVLHLIFALFPTCRPHSLINLSSSCAMLENGPRLSQLLQQSLRIAGRKVWRWCWYLCLLVSDGRQELHRVTTAGQPGLLVASHVGHRAVIVI